MQILFYLNFSDKASRTNFVGRSIAISLRSSELFYNSSRKRTKQESLNSGWKCSQPCFSTLLMYILFYLNFSDQASRTNFLGRSIEIYNHLNAALKPVDKNCVEKITCEVGSLARDAGLTQNAIFR